MKKLPIFLSTLGLAASSLAVPLRMTDTALASDFVWGRAKPDMNAVWRGTDEDGFVTNAIDERLLFKSLALGGGQLKMSFWFPQGNGGGARKMLFAAFDYMNGVTEEEADQKALRLGEEGADTTWAGRIDVVDFGSPSSGEASTTAWLYYGASLMRDNRSDILYYAMEVKESDAEGAPSRWYRGKLDYRSCAHSWLTRNGYTQVCAAVPNWDDFTITFEPQVYSWAETELAEDYGEDGPWKDERILTWKEELAGIVAEQLKSVSDRKEIAEYYLSEARSWLQEMNMFLTDLPWQLESLSGTIETIEELIKAAEETVEEETGETTEEPDVVEMVAAASVRLEDAKTMLEDLHTQLSGDTQGRLSKMWEEITNLTEELKRVKTALSNMNKATEYAEETWALGIQEQETRNNAQTLEQWRTTMLGYIASLNKETDTLGTTLKALAEELEEKPVEGEPIEDDPEEDGPEGDDPAQEEPATGSSGAGSGSGAGGGTIWDGTSFGGLGGVGSGQATESVSDKGTNAGESNKDVSTEGNKDIKPSDKGLLSGDGLAGAVAALNPVGNMNGQGQPEEDFDVDEDGLDEDFDAEDDENELPEGYNEEVALPALSAVKEETVKMPWLLLGAVVSGLMLVIWWVKRAFFSDKKISETK